MHDPVVVLVGPTASGKSALAAAIAAEFGGVVINADSMQVYRELAILTARPGEEAMRRVPHRLYGVLPAAEGCSVARWLELALAEIGDAHRSGRLPVVAGGTGLYIKALLTGLSEIPEIPANIRAAARAKLAGAGAAALYDDLRRSDPAAAARLRPNDRQRLIRAWEVLEATGRSITDWQANAPPQPSPNLRFLMIVLLPSRQTLWATSDDRFQTMVERGALAEVERLLRLKLDEDKPAMRAIGVPELTAHLRGELSLAEAIEQAQRATRHYIKRQTTWLRHQLTADRVIHAQYSESLNPEIFSFIRQFLLTAAR